MAAVDQGDGKGQEPGEEQFPEGARRAAERVRRPIGTAMHLAVRHESWTSEGIGEAVYTFALRILKWEGNDSMGRKTNRLSQVEAELGIPMGDKGEDWEAISIAERWVAINDQFALHVLVSPIEICEILMGWGQGVLIARQKLRINSERRSWKSIRKCSMGFDRSKSGKQFHRRGGEGLGKSRSRDGNPNAHAWIYAKK